MTSNDLPLIHTSGLVGLTDFVRAEFGDRTVARAYADAGLARDVERRAPGFIPEVAVVHFLASAARLMGDEFAGVRLATAVSFARYGEWGRYLSQAADLEDCVMRLKRIVPLHTPYDGVRVERIRGAVWIRQRFPSAAKREYRHLAWATLGIFVDLCRQFLGPDWLPLAGEIDLTEARHAEAVERVFPFPLTYGARAIGLAIRPDDLRVPRLPPESRLTTFSDVLRERGPRREFGFLPAVREAIDVQVRASEVSLEHMARMFDMGPRRLQRRLSDEGCTFRTLANAAKVSRACALLVETNLPIKSIAGELGYAHLPTFTGAFAAITGSSPTVWRHRQQP
ncbi:MAG: AraC family transcriptional regulator ligand-binding domain-containing protein [Pseudomonadota bacterium]